MMLGWVSIEKEAATPACAAWVSALCRATQHHHIPELHPSDQPGILIANHCDDTLLEKLPHYAEQASHRLILICCQPMLSLEQQLHLIAAGVSRLFCWQDTHSLLQAVLGQLQRWAQIDRILSARAIREQIIGQSPAWLKVLRHTVEIGRYSNANVLLLGEPGTGKELIARLLHTVDQREHKQDLVVLDCTTVVPELAGSEFFGHEKGAFTNAIRTREGMFEQAAGGTLFLDEVGELPAFLQASLLRVIQEKAYKKVGGDRWHNLDFRLVSATNRDLESAQQQGTFRQDFFHRIASYIIRLPPLRMRKDDIPLLLDKFLQEELSEQAPTVDPTVIHALQAHDFPGNVRELRQLVRAMCGRYNGYGALSTNDIPRDYLHKIGTAYFADYEESFHQPVLTALHHGMDLKTLKEYVADIARTLTLQEEHGNMAKAAERLGITVRSLQQFRAKWTP
jgi:Transcriptional regulator containing GAF, AAA-type ATPase, and DNA binding domains